MKTVVACMMLALMLPWDIPADAEEMGRLSLLVPGRISEDRIERTRSEPVQAARTPSPRMLAAPLPLDHNLAQALRYLGYEAEPGRIAVVPVDRTLADALHQIRNGSEAYPPPPVADAAAGGSNAPLPVDRTLAKALEHLGYDVTPVSKPKSPVGTIVGREMPPLPLSHQMSMALQHLGYDTTPGGASDPESAYASAAMPVSSQMQGALIHLGYAHAAAR